MSNLKTACCDNCIFYRKDNARRGVCDGNAVEMINVITGKQAYVKPTTFRYYRCIKHKPKI